MTNLIKFDTPSKAEVVPQQTFKYTIIIECYFRDRSKQLFKFERNFPEKILSDQWDPFSVECYRHLYTEVDKTKLMLTWQKNYYTTPDGESRSHVETLPMLHFGNTVESVFI